MSKIFVLISFILISSCSQNKNENKESDNKVSTNILMESLIYDINSESLSTSSIEISITPDEIIEQQIDVVNNHRSASVLMSNISLTNLQGTSIASDSCSSSTLLRKQKCFFTLKVDGSTLTSGDLIEGFVVINGKNVPMNITVNEIVEDLTPETLNITPNPLDLGTLKSGESSEGTIVVYNRERGSKNINIESLSLEGLSILDNSCPAILLGRKKCFIKVGYQAPSEILLSELLSDTLTISGNEISININLEADEIVDESCSTEDPKIVLTGYELEGEQRVVDLVSINDKTILVRNNDRETKNLCINKNGLDELKVSMNGCQSTIGRRQRCFLKFEKIETLDINHEIFINGQSYLIKTSPDTPICEEIDAQNNGYNVSLYEEIIGQKDIAGTNISQCSITCPTGYSLDNTLKACVKQCDESNSIINGVNPLNVTSYLGTVVGTDVSQCLVNLCTEGTYVSSDQKSCQEAEPCNESDLNTLSFNTSLYEEVLGNKIEGDLSQCSMSCPTGYSLDNTLKACVASCDESSSILNGVIVNNALTYEGQIVGTDVSQCLINSCNPGNAVATDKKSCISSVPCVESDLISNGFNVSLYEQVLGSKLLSDTSQCSMSCPSGYTLQNKACVSSCNATLTASNGAIVTNASTYQGQAIGADVSQCLINTCNSGYVVSSDNKNCNEVIACSENDSQLNGYNISLYETITGDKVLSDVSQCSITCPSGYTLQNKACTASCSQSDAVSNGVDPTNALTYQGQVIGSDVSQCLINTCSSGFTTSVDKKSCIAESSVNLSRPISTNTINANPSSLRITGSNTSSSSIISNGQSVFLSATNNNLSDYAFKNWTGDVCNNLTSTSCSFVMGSSDINITANYELKQCNNLNDIRYANWNGSNLDSSGIDPSSISGDYSTGCSFQCIDNYGLSGQTCVLTHANITVSKNIVETSVSSSIPSLSIDNTSLNASDTISVNTSITLTANETTNYEFLKWSGGVCNNSTNNICSFTVTENISLSANFQVRQCETLSDITSTSSITDTNGILTSSISGDYINGCTYSCGNDFIANTTDASIACDAKEQYVYSFRATYSFPGGVATLTPYLAKYNLDGGYIWQKQIPTAKIGVDKAGYLYVLDSNGKLRKLNSSDGSQVWISSTTYTNISEYKIDELGDIYASSGEDLIKINQNNGEPIWTKTFPAGAWGITSISMKDSDSYLYITWMTGTGSSSFEGVLGKISKSNGSTVWTSEGRLSVMSSDGSLYVYKKDIEDSGLVNNFEIRKINQSNGATLSTINYDFRITGDARKLLISPNSNYFYIMSDYVFWELDLNGGSDNTLVSSTDPERTSMDLNGNLYNHTNGSSYQYWIRKIDPNNGSIIWQIQTTGSIYYDIEIGF